MVRPWLLLCVFALGVVAVGIGRVRAGDECGCGTPSKSWCHLHHCRKCCPGSTSSRDQGRGKSETRGAPPAAPVYSFYPIVPVSMAMMAPVATTGTRGRNDEQTRGDDSGGDRIAQMERDLYEVRVSITRLEVLAKGQMEVIGKIQERLKKLEQPPGTPLIPLQE